MQRTDKNSTGTKRTKPSGSTTTTEAGRLTDGRIPAGTKQAPKKLKGFINKAAQKRGRS